MSKHSLITKARKRYKAGIKPVSGRSNLMQCFTEMDGIRYFWFNDCTIGSTHILKESIK